MSDPLIESVRKALGRSQPLTAAPIPPNIADSVARLVAKDGNLTDLFAKSASEAQFQLQRTRADKIASDLSQFLRERQCKRVGIPASPRLEKLNIPQTITDGGAEIVRWSESTLDAAYDLDCGVTDVYAAVAETGSLVIRPGTHHGRALSLVPPIHVAIVEPADIVADLIDLLEKIESSDRVPNITLITGPSKTADIEGALVTGVHGPGVVRVYLISPTL